MKKLTSAISIFVSALAMCFATSCNSSSTGAESTDGAKQHDGEILTPTEGSTVYVQMDSLLNQYDMFIDLKAEIEVKVKKVQDDLDTKARAFQRDATDFQDKVNRGLITTSEAQRKYEELGRREQELMEQRQKVSMELEEEQTVMLNRINESINSYVKVYNEEKSYSLIINTSGNSTILWGNPGLDITTDLVKGLNEAYSKSLKTLEKESTPPAQ